MSTPDPRQCWRTPPELWAKMNRIWQFDMDAAADAQSALCGLWCGPDHLPDYRDGLSADWASRTYCNPGYANVGPWLAKAWREVRQGKCELAVVLTHVSTSTEWFLEAMKADEIIFLWPRVNFVPAPGVKSSSNNKDNMLSVFRRGIPSGAPKFSVWNWREDTP